MMDISPAQLLDIPDIRHFVRDIVPCLLALVILVSPLAAHAACSAPAGVAGAVVYNTTQKLSQYCDGTNWIRMNPMAGSGSGGCTNPTAVEGAITYNDDEYVMQVCAGNVWKSMGPPGGSRQNEWAQVDGGNNMYCGIKNNGSLWCWGYGIAGDGSAQGYTYSPVRIGSAKWKMISVGSPATCGIKSDDSLWCWGTDSNGSVGDGGAAVTQLNPVAVNDGGASWKYISAGNYTSCGIQIDDTLWCWGGDLRGQIGDGSPESNQFSPVQIGTDTWKTVAGAESSTGPTCGIKKADDSMWCWGYGYIGNGSSGSTIYNSPVAIAAGQTWKDVAVLSSAVCGIKTDDTLWCWGADSNGILANGAVTGTKTTPYAAGDGGAWEAIEGSYLYHFCGRQTNDTLWCWGWQYNGMIGNGTGGGGSGGSQESPAQVSGGGAWLDVGVGSTSTCGIQANGKVSCWGVAYGEPTDTLLPVPIAGGHKWEKIATSGYYYNGWMEHACGIRTDGVLMCWGGNDHGQLGDNGAESMTSTPITVPGGYSWSDIATGRYYTCGVRDDGVAMCWGRGTGGQLGNGASSDSFVPVTVSGGYTWAQLSSVSGTTCGVRTDGVAMCWGYGTSGQLGNGADLDSNVPVTVSGGYTWQMVSAGGSHSCGIRTDGVAMCWGLNSRNQLGDGTTNPSNVPVTVTGGYTWRYISAGYSNTCGIRTDGEQMCWGYDQNWNIVTTPTLVPAPNGGVWQATESGRSDPDTRCGITDDGRGWCIGWLIGNGDGIEDYANYMEVAGGAKWKQIMTGEEFVCGVATNGDGYCWGYNWNGQMGSGEDEYVTTPVENIGCNNPLAEAGTMFYNADFNVMQYCDGSGWYAIGK